MEAGVLTGLQAEEHLIGFPIVFEVRRLVGLKEEEVEVPWRLRCGAFIRRTKEKVATSASPVLTPFKFMLPDSIAAHIGGRIRFFKNHSAQGVKVVFIKLAVIKRLGSLVDQRVEVDVFLEIKVVLAVLWIERQKLTADCFQDLA